MEASGNTRRRASRPEARAQLLAGFHFAERRLDLGGISTALIESGDGPPVVLLHGIGSFSPEWSLVIQQLAKRSRVIAPDLPGLGASDAHGRRLDVSNLSNWLLELVERTCVEAPTIVGHSAGGSLAAHFAIQHGHRVRRIILVAASSLGRFRPAPGVFIALLRFGARPSPTSRERFLRQVLADHERARGRWDDRWVALEAYDLEQARDKRVSGVNGQLVRRIGARRISPDQLATIDVPASLIWGKQDRLMRFRIAQDAHSRFGWPLHSIDDCGHGPQIERPDALAELIAGIMDS